MDECVRCMKTKATCSYVKCNHIMYCASCIFNLYNNKMLKKECPMCTQSSTHISAPCKCGKVTILYNFEANKIILGSNICSECTEVPSTVPPVVNDKFFTMIRQDKIQKIAAIEAEILSIFTPVPDKHIKILLELLYKAISDTQWIARFREIYKLIEAEGLCDKCIYMFTSDQMKMVGESMNKYSIRQEYYFIYNELVALCMFPWDLPKKIFTHGVC